MAQTKQPRPATKVVGEKTPPTEMGQRITAAERRAQRAAEAKAMQKRKQRRNLLIAAVGAVVVLLVVIYLGREQLINQEIGVAVADEGGGHVNTGDALTFAHYPPSSGKHYPTAQPAGIYRQEVQEGFWVHSLEHGYIVAAVKCTTDCDTIFGQLDDIYKSLPNSQFGNVKFGRPRRTASRTPMATPRSPSSPGTTSRSSITSIATTITRFYKKFVDKGPELVP